MVDRDPPKPPPARGPRPAPKPTPVRSTMGDVPEAPDLRFEGRSVRLGEEEWWAQELGWTLAGRREDEGVLLLLVGFRPAAAPEGEYQREALVAASSLAALSEEALEEILASAGEFREIPEEPADFFGPRGKRRTSARGGKGRSRRGR